jgi:hypothetical protein
MLRKPRRIMARDALALEGKQEFEHLNESGEPYQPVPDQSPAYSKSE